MNKITSIQNPEYVSFIKIKHFLEDIENSIALSNMNQSSGVNLVMQRIESIGPNDVNQDALTSSLIKKIDKKILEKFKTSRQAFKFFDYDQNGVVTYGEFVKGIEGMGIHMFDNESKKLFDYLDKN